ncbi:unnamed protein product [Spirodela intermedia]|uniref:Uncharacterized protein n=1 Tax=Spirodela intermedia TaxID=51605 RepID=A0ABN7EA31_SPIIN|nr:unnamed protein product [Spirodela intermedia]
MSRQIVSGGCHLAKRKNGDFAALRRLSPDGKELDEVGACQGASSSSPHSKRRLFIASIPHRLCAKFLSEYIVDHRDDDVSTRRRELGRNRVPPGDSY